VHTERALPSALRRLLTRSWDEAVALSRCARPLETHRPDPGVVTESWPEGVGRFDPVPVATRSRPPRRMALTLR